METKVEKLEKSTKVSFKLDAKEWDAFIDRAYQQQKGKINIPGFRKGFAPRHLVEKMYGKGVFLDEAFELCFKHSYAKFLMENPDIYPVEEPKVDVSTISDSGIEFSAEFAVKPEVELGQYKGLTVVKKEYKTAKSDIEAEINKARERLARHVDKDGAAENGDTVNIDYSGSVDGVKFEGGTAKGHDLVLGSNSFIPGFEAQLVGINKGESRDITVTFPAEYHAEELKGKEAVFAVTANTITTKVLPELNDEMAKDVSRFDTLKEFTADIEKRLDEANASKGKNETENDMISMIVDGAKVAIPDSMVDTELSYMLEDMGNRLMYMYGGMKLEDYFKYTGGSEAEFRKANRAEAEKNVKTRLTLEKIVAVEGIEVTESDVDTEVAVLAERDKKSVEEFKKNFNREQENYIKNMVLSRKLMEFLTIGNELVSKPKKASAKSKS